MHINLFWQINVLNLGFIYVKNLQIEIFVNFSSYLIIVVFSLVGVAFLTLLERKLLGYVQLRKGPNKVGVIGLFQPFSDAVKLFTKEFFFPLKSNFNLY